MLVIYLTLFFVKVMPQSGSMEVVATSYFSRSSSKIFDENLLFLYFILENSHSQMYVLPKTSIESLLLEKTSKI